MSPAELVNLPTGRCVIVNPHFQKGNDAYIPIVESIPLSRGYKNLIAQSKKRWRSLREDMILQNEKRAVTKDDLSARYDEADRMLPSTEAPGNGRSRRQDIPLDRLLTDENSPLFFS